MFDETETIDGNPKSWAAWKREAERLQKIIDEMTTNHPAHGPVSLARLHQISEILSKAAAQSDGGNLGYAMADAVKVIDEVLNAEPVLYAAEETLAYAKMGELHLKCLSQPMGDAVIPLYTATPAQVVQPVMFIDGDISASDAEKLAAVIREWDDAPAPERDRVRREHAEWSQATFGDVGPVGPLKHLSKEALEAAAEPGDLSEWADMQFLLWDAQRRAGISDEQITLAMVEKLAVNKQREWPEPKDGEPRLHIKEQPAPVVPEYPETLPCPVLLEPGMRFGKGVKTRLVLEAIQRRAEHYAELEAMTPEQRAEHDAGIEAIKAMLPKPAQPDIEMLASALTNAPLAPSDRQGRPRAPVVPEECKEAPAYVKALTKEGAYIYGFNACRAAMQSFGNSEKLDEVGSWNNHMNTPTAKPAIDTGELLKRIEGMEVSVDVSTCDADAGNRYFGTVTEISELDTAKNGYILLVQDAKPNFKWAGNSPATPDAWIPVSERMPESEVYVQLYCADSREQMVGCMEREETEGYFRFSTWRSGKGIYCKPTHWMPLTAPPRNN